MSSRSFARTSTPFPSLLSLENLSFWEHFHNTAGWNKTHETGWFLCQSRIMLVQERGDELWLAPFATSAWFKDGQRIAVTRGTNAFRARQLHDPVGRRAGTDRRHDRTTDTDSRRSGLCCACGTPRESRCSR